MRTVATAPQQVGTAESHGPRVMEVSTCDRRTRAFVRHQAVPDIDNRRDAAVPGSDVICGFGGNDTIYGGDGTDTGDTTIP